MNAAMQPGKNGWTLKFFARTFLACFLIIELSGCGISEQDANRRAATFRIDGQAPIKSDNSIVVSAPPHVVWHFITDIGRWSTWRSEVSVSHLNGSLAAGTPFTWTVGGTDISSQIAALDGQSRIAWTGHAMGLTAIHIWQIQPIAPDKTLVRTMETMTGFPSSLFYSSADLHATNAKWLTDLKRISEHAGATDAKQH